MHIGGAERVQRLQERRRRAASMRAETARPTSTSAVVRGGGRLYAQSPISGYSEQEMIKEAQLRLEHNKQRLRLDMQAAMLSNASAVVSLALSRYVASSYPMHLGVGGFDAFGDLPCNADVSEPTTKHTCRCLRCSCRRLGAR